MIITPLKQQSITYRLCFFISISTLIIFLSISGLLYWLLMNNYANNTASFLVNEMSLINSILQHSHNKRALEQEIEWEPRGNNYKYLASIKNTRGEIMTQTPSINKIFSDIVWPVIPQNGNLSKIEKVKTQGKVYALITGAARIKKQKFIVHVAYDITNDQEVLAWFLKQLFFITLFGVLILLLISFFMIYFGLKPLRTFVHEITHIGTDDLDKRLVLDNTYKELKPLVVSFNSLMDRIERGYERLSIFSANIAHELRTPINNLIVETEVMSNRIKDNKATKNLLESNLEEYQRLASIIDKLLFIAKTDAKKLQLDKEELSLHDEVQAVVEFHEALANEHQLEISIQGNAQIRADKTLLRNAISNVLTNAIKYAYLGKKIIIKIKDEQDKISLSFADFGFGVSIKDTQNIVKAFYRADAHRNRKMGGVGLGLAIVDSIVKSHNGSVIVKRNQPHGLVVTLCFPR